MAYHLILVTRETVISRVRELPGESYDGKDVITLTDSNFEKTVLQSEDLWLVEFFAPWCGHCKNLAPHWANAATQLKGKVKLGAVDATEHKVLASKFGIQGFPTIKFFGAGKKDWDSSEKVYRLEKRII